METNALVKIVEQSGLDKQKQDYLLEKFSDATLLAESWAAKAKEIVVTDESQTDLMKSAREGRLLLKDKRVEIEKTRKQLKDSSLKEGRAIDDIAKALTALIEPTEKYLDEQEKFAERKEADRIMVLDIERKNLLQPYVDTVVMSFPQGQLGKMPQQQFDAMLSGYKSMFEKRISDEKLAEEQRIAKQKADEEARAAQRIENERLKKEADEREKQFAEERKAAQEKADKERKEAEEKARKEREAFEAKLKEEKRIADEQKAKLQKQLDDENARRKAEEQAQLKLIEEQEKLASAGDKEKIKDLIQRLNDFNFPEVKSKKAKAIVGNATDTIKNLIIIVTQSSSKL